MQVDPGAVKLQRLRPVTVPILVRERDLGRQGAQSLPPLAEEEETPGYGELAQPMREAEIRIVRVAVDQDREALGGIPVGGAVLGGAPPDEVGVDQM